MAAVTLSSLDTETFNHQIRTSPLDMMMRLHQEGTVCVIRSEEKHRLVVTSEPELAAAALAHGSRNHRELLRQLVGSGLFVVTSGEQWRRRRGLLRPMFAARAVAELHSLVIEATEDFARRELLPAAGKEIDLAETLQQLSIEIILRLVEPELRGPELAALTAALHAAVGYLDTRLFDPDKVREADEDRFTADRKVLEDFIAERAARQTCPATGRGLLADLVAALREDGQEVDRGQALTEELLSVFVAGVETMGTLLTWIFHNLEANPEACDRALREVLAEDLRQVSALPSLPSGTLPYTRAVVEESLRLHPPAWALFRRIDAPLEAAGVRLEVDDVVMSSTWAIHRAPQLWDRPEEFRPERFLGERPPTQQYFPFGAGPHQCLGRQFSLLEAQLASAVILRHGTLRVDIPPGGTGLRPTIALAPHPHPRARFLPHAAGAGRGGDT
ncbi:cytochrome P450 [Streptomyces sp. NPDC058646]|uniref:cytochrome P450 n=1 Tax=Streptomyces sp. NPDC058646 TaxID=3346574 RepID=UPI00364C0A9E